MRITNNMMINNTSANINGNKVNFMFTNNQMSSQKKIQRPSENPVIAIRSLRLRTTLSQVNQYYEKNIPDAQTWLETAETALKNMNKILSDVKTQCNTGTNSYLTEEDRDTILKSLTALRTQLYSEGNADNAGRTVFTGYRTGSQLTFMEDEKDTAYQITQDFSYKDIEEYTYYSGTIEAPRTVADVEATGNIKEIYKDSYDRIRLAYDDIGKLNSVSYRMRNTGAAAQDTVATVQEYDTEQAWEDAGAGRKTIGDDEIIFIKSTGDLILGKNVSTALKAGEGSLVVDYEKTGFEKGVLRPEYYYNCTDITPDNAKPIPYVKYKEVYDADGNRIYENADGERLYEKVYEDIDYTVAMNQTLTVNMQADELFDMNIYQDVVELTNAVQKAINAHESLDKLKEMKNEAQYADYQEQIQKWIDAAKKEADYADKQLTELYSAGIGKFDGYMNTLNIAYTELGARGEQLEMTETRMSNQQLTVEDLKSQNEDEELSDILINYTAAYNAYQASLMAASKIEKQTLLDYI